MNRRGLGSLWQPAWCSAWHGVSNFSTQLVFSTGEVVYLAWENSSLYSSCWNDLYLLLITNCIVITDLLMEFVSSTLKPITNIFQFLQSVMSTLHFGVKEELTMHPFNSEQCGKFGTRYESHSSIMALIHRKPFPESKLGCEENYKNEAEGEKWELSKGYG